MKKILTKDNSYTFYSDNYRETYHTFGGAFQEAFRKYVEPCKIKKYKDVKILDICFGLGYNSCAVIHEILKNKGKVKLVGLEKDPKILKKIRNLEVPGYIEDSFNVIRKVSKSLRYKDDKVDIILLVGDARKTIKQLDDKFDFVFLDPFSTRKNPELWTVDFFNEIKKLIKENGILATYSCSTYVRNGLIMAGFKIGDGPIFGRVMPGTLATIKGVVPNLKDEKILKAFNNVFRDPELKWGRERILREAGL